MQTTVPVRLDQPEVFPDPNPPILEKLLIFVEGNLIYNFLQILVLVEVGLLFFLFFTKRSRKRNIMLVLVVGIALLAFYYFALARESFGGFPIIQDWMLGKRILWHPIERI